MAQEVRQKAFVSELTPEMYLNGIRATEPNEHLNELVRSKILAKFNESDDPRVLIEQTRYKQDCRKKALEFGANTAFRDVSNNSSESVLMEADKYYKWLISIPEN